MNQSSYISRLVIAVLLASCAASLQAAESTPPRRVLVLHSYHKGFTWTDSVEQGLEKAFNEAKAKVEFSVEYMDTKRHPIAQLAPTLTELYKAKYRRWTPELIVSCDDDALQFLFQHREHLFPGVPVVFCGLDVDHFDPSMLAGRTGYTGVVERLDPASTLELILQMRPKTDRVVFIHDRTTSGLADRRTIEQLAPQYAGRVRFVFPDRGDGLTEQQLIEFLRGLDDRSTVFFLGFFRDRDDRPLATGDIIPAISRASSVPVFAHAEAYLGHGILGGKLLSGEVHGHSTGLMALRILDGQSPEDLPVSIESSNRYMFDRRQMQRFDITEDDLPEDSRVLYGSVSFFQRHRRAILATVAAVLVLGAFTLFLLANTVRLHRAERRLVASEQRYRNLVERSPDIVYIFSSTRGALYWSQRVKAILGFTPDQLTDEPFAWFDAVHPDDRQLVLDAIVGDHSNDDFDIQYRIADTHGNWHWLRDRSIGRHRDGDEMIIEGLATDITERKVAVEKLAEREQMYRDLFEKNRAVKLFIDPDNGHIVEANPAASDFYGYTHEQLTSMTIMQINAADDDTIHAEMQHARSSDKEYFEFRHRLADGSTREVAVHSSPLAWQGRTVLFSIVTDITEGKQARHALQESEQRLRAIFDSMPLYLALWQKADPDRFVLKEVNPASEALSEGNIQQWLGTPLERFYKNAPWLIEAIKRCHREGKVVEVEDEYVLRTTGQQRYLGLRFVPVSDDTVMAVAEDLTDRHRAERALARQNANMQAMIENTGDIVCLRDHEGRLVTWNTAFAEICRRIFDLDPTVGMNTVDHLPDPARDHWRDMVAQVLRGTPYREQFDWTFTDGETRHYDLSLNPVVEDGKVTGFTEFSRDITDRVEMEEKLRQVETMQAIGKLAGGVAHDFNNKLAGLLGYADMLRSRTDDETLKRYAGNIVEAARQSARLTDQLLAYSRQGKYRTIPVDMHKVVDQTVNILGRSVDKRVTIHNHLNAGEPVIVGDPHQLGDMLLNLATNACDAMPRGGTLTFETDTVNLDRRYIRAIGRQIDPGTYLRVSVIDNGCGMNAQTRKHLFEPFFTTKEIGKGSGMGLPAVHGIVEHHGGAISVYSEPDQGTTVHVYLPLADERSSPGATVQPAVPAPAEATVLVVDDERIFRDLARDMLESAGYTVVCRADGQAAVDWYRDHAHEVDLVVLDMVMPKLDGYDTFRAMREIDPDARVLVASGYSLNERTQEMLDNGAAAFMQKPFTEADLTRIVANLLSPGAGQAAPEA